MNWILRFFIAVTVLSFAELYLLVYVAQQSSFWVTMALCVLTGIVGGAMVRAQSLQTFREIQVAFGRMEVPARPMVAGVILLVIGALLMTPGFITDTLAFLMLTPSLRNMVADWLIKRFQHRVMVRTSRPFTQARQQAGRVRPEGVVIDVEAEQVVEQANDKR